MSSKQEILDLVASWAQSRESGQPVAVEELCGGRDDLAREVRARIDMLEKMRWLHEYDPAEDAAGLSLPSPTFAFSGGETLLDDSLIAADEFRHRLLASGLMAEAKLREFEQQISPDGPICSALVLARELVTQQQLTRYQVRTIAAGRGQQLVLGNYVILDKVGQGGMGQVFKARHQRMDRLVALKILPEQSVETPGAVERFHREVQAAARLTHPNIVTAYDADESRGTHFLVMELVDGVDLAQLVARQGPLEIRATLDCLVQVARGLQYAHSKGIVHRDIKPANLLIDHQGQVRILDMGLARLTQGATEQGTQYRLTTDGTVLGTIDFMAPEQAANTQTADARSDIYSLGCTLYYLLTGRPPFDGQSLLDRLLAHRDIAIPDLAIARPDAPPCLVQIFERSLAKRPEERFADMATFQQEVESCRQMCPGAMPSVDEPVNLLGPRALSDASRDTSSLLLLDTVKRKRPAEMEPQDTAEMSADVMQESGVGNQNSGFRIPRFALRIGLALGLAALLIAAATIYRIQTDRGTIIVEIDDDNVAAKLQKDGLILEDATGKRTWKLQADQPGQIVPSGDYKLAPQPGLVLRVTDDTGAEFKTDEFKIRRGGKVIVSVKAEPLRVAQTPRLPATAPPAELPPATLPPAVATPPVAVANSSFADDPDQIAADWVMKQPGGMVDLRHLNAAGQQVAPTDPTAVDARLLRVNLPQPPTDWKLLAKLEHLYHIDTALPAHPNWEELKQIPVLTELGFWSPLPSDDCLDPVRDFPALTYFAFNGRMNERHLQSLQSLPQLSQLSVTAGEALPAEVSEDLAKLPQLRELTLHCPLHNEDFPNLAKLTSLQRLALTHYTWDPEQLPQLKPLKQLRRLDVAILEAERPPLAVLVRELPELRELHITFARKLVPDALDGLGEHPHLEVLSLSEMAVNDALLKKIESLPRLRELNLSTLGTTNIESRRALLLANRKLTMRFSDGTSPLTYSNSGAVLEGPVLFPKPLPGIRRWQIVTTNPHAGQTACAFSTDGKRLAIASAYTRLVRVLDGETNELLTAVCADNTVAEVQWAADGRIVLRGQSGFEPVQVFDTTGKLTSLGAVGSARSFAVHPREPLVALGHVHTGAVQLQPLNGSAGLVLQGPAGIVFALAWHPQGERLAAATYGEKLIRIWRRDGQLEKVVELPSPVSARYASDLAWNAAGSLLAVATEDGKTYLFQSDGAPAGELPISPPLVWHPRENVVYGWQYVGQTCGLFGFAPGGERKDYISHGQDVTSASWRPDGKRLVTATALIMASLTPKAQGYDANWKSLSAIAWSDPNPNAIAWSADGQSLWRSFSNKLTRWQADGNRAEVFHATAADQWCDAIVQNPAKPLVFATNAPQSEGYLFATDGTLQRTVRGIRNSIGTPAWSPTGEWAVLNTVEGDVRLYSSEGRRGAVLQGAKPGPTVIAWSLDGKRLALATQGQPAAIWNVDGTPGPVLAPRPGGIVRSLAWSPDGQSLVVSEDTMVLRIYRATDGTQVRQALENKGAGASLALQWNADDTLVGVSLYNGLLQRWTAQGQYLGNDPLVPGYVLASRLNPQDERRVNIYSDLRHIVFDAQHEPLVVGQPLGWDGEWLSLAPDGTLLHQSENAEKLYRYLVEHEDGRFETLTPVEFHRRTNNAVLPAKP